MHKILIVLVFTVLLSGAAVAEVDQSVAAKREAFWSKIDAKTDWGKWLLTEFRPYSDKTTEALLSLSQGNGDMRQRYEQCFEALKKITPPADLKEFHTKQLAIFAMISKNVPTNAEQAAQQNAVLKKLSDDMNKELVQVLTKHGVTGEIIDGFTKAQ
jgi:hypothetical protein